MKHLPNLISLLRLFMSPYVFFLSYSGDHKSAAILFFLLALSDAIDGMLARVLKAQTTTGKMLDPLADKLLLFFGLLSITFYTQIRASIYLLSILFARDTFLVLGSLFLRKLGFVPEPTISGKLTTFSVVITVLLGFAINVFGVEELYRVFTSFEILSFVLIAVSTLDYALKGLGFLRDKLIMERR